MSRWWLVSGPRRFRCRLPKTGSAGPRPIAGTLPGCKTWRWRCNCAAGSDADALGAALADVVARHESLQHPYRCNPRHTPAAGGCCRACRLRSGTSSTPPAWSAAQLSEGPSPPPATVLTSRPRSLSRVIGWSPSPIDEHVLVGVAHHIAADGWSIAPLVFDLGEVDAIRCAGRAPGWAELPVKMHGDPRLLAAPSSSAISMTATAPSPPSWPTGRMPGPACPSGCSCPPIGPAPRRWLISAAQCGTGLAGRAAPGGARCRPRVQRDQFHGGAGRFGGVAVSG